jgi:alkylation response protein AidB-like acyl-CoA dehydrogenase
VTNVTEAVEEQGTDYDSMFSSMAKVFAADTAVDICQRSLEKFGGMGSCSAHRYRSTSGMRYPSCTRTALKRYTPNGLRTDFRNVTRDTDRR